MIPLLYRLSYPGKRGDITTGHSEESNLLSFETLLKDMRGNEISPPLTAQEIENVGKTAEGPLDGSISVRSALTYD